jgi:DNA-binding LacI/PurR family transcriptional regulator
MQNVANLAGVSVTTVWRYINSQARVGPAVAKRVRSAMDALKFEPVLSRGERKRKPDGDLSVASIVFGMSGPTLSSGFDGLLWGISRAAQELKVRLTFAFTSSKSQLPPTLSLDRIDGLLFHGQAPRPELQRRLKGVPVMWLMADGHRPAWGHHVIPDNAMIGQLAAQYLIQRGHRRLACLSIVESGWAVGMRTTAFDDTAGRVGAKTHVLALDGSAAAERWSLDHLNASARDLVDQLMKVRPWPTGLFIADERLLVALNAELVRRGVETGRNKDLEIVACNYQQQFLNVFNERPAFIDTRMTVIGSLGLEQLVERIRRPDAHGRRCIQVEPKLVPPDVRSKSDVSGGEWDSLEAASSVDEYAIAG